MNKLLSGTAIFRIMDAYTNEEISEKFGLPDNFRCSFSLDKESDGVVYWRIKVPRNFNNIIFKTMVEAEGYTDGEQKSIAVLPNRILVTDVQPIFVRRGEMKTFTLKNLSENNFDTVSHFAVALELNTHPIWDVIFALPSLRNNQNHFADVVFNRWFAGVLASEIVRRNPKIKTIFEQYGAKDLLKSKLEMDQELKSLFLQETPWLLDGENQARQMKRLAMLFEVNTMKNHLQTDWQDTEFRRWVRLG